MNSLRAVTENQIRAFLNVSDEEFMKLRNPAPEHMHDPEEYLNMNRLVAYLHEEKMRQEADPQKMLGIFGDYDTDGVCASALLSGSFAVFGFRYMTCIPTMDEGYGINQKGVDRMIALVEKQGYRLDMILTADNGIAAHDGIAYAAGRGITVVVTDHHPSGKKLPQGAAVCVDPWQEKDAYPFKYNSGATVAWKVMLQYARTWEPEKLPLIKRLIVLAGLSNVGDVMPIMDENRYMVTAALKILKELRQEYDYQRMANTKYGAYNAIFWGLHDMIHLLQEDKDVKRAKKKKSSISLPDNEELISFYLSPMLNAPRRVHGTCLEAMSALMVSDHEIRKDMIRKLIELNSIKSDFRDRVLKAVKPDEVRPVICVNTRHGISGLIAGKLSGGEEMPSIVFSRRDDESEIIVYEDVPEDGVLKASARSTELCPLDRVIDEVNRQFPGMIRGGGHATAAGLSIDAKDYLKLKEILPDICRRIIGENKAARGLETENRVKIRCRGENRALSVEFERVIEGVLTKQELFLDTKQFAGDIKDTYLFLESLRPFGEGFRANTQFELEFDNCVHNMDWNPSFWKTFKFNLYGVECLTFDDAWADQVKKDLENGQVVTASAEIKMNEFRGRTTPQLLLSPL